jgi:hypothetical protein
VSRFDSGSRVRAILRRLCAWAARSVARVEPQSRALPESDLEAIFGVLAVVHGNLLADQLLPDLVRQLVNRLTRHGPLPDGASPGELNALLGDLCQRMHWAMSYDYGDYPEPMPRRTTYYLDIPDGEIDACTTALINVGGEVRRHRIDDTAHPNGGQIAAAFPDLPPDRGRGRRGRYAPLSRRRPVGSAVPGSRRQHRWPLGTPQLRPSAPTYDAFLGSRGLSHIY